MGNARVGEAPYLNTVLFVPPERPRLGMFLNRPPHKQSETVTGQLDVFFAGIRVDGLPVPVPACIREQLPAGRLNTKR